MQRQTELVSFGVLLFALAVCACGPNAIDQGEFHEQVFDAGADTSSVQELTRETGAEQVEVADGTWIHYSQLGSCVDIGSQSFDNLNRTLYLVDVVQDDFGVIEETWRGCDVELSPVLNLVPALRRENLDTIYPVVTAGGLVDNTTLEGGYASAPVAELWGVDLDDPVNDILPVSGDDDRIIDSDGDGNPGATLVFGTDICEAFVTQRTSTIYSGSYETFDRIEGTVISASSQFVIDASTAFCRTGYINRPNSPRGTFARQRVDGQGGSLDLDTDGDDLVTCDEIISALFDRLILDDEVCY